uniref:Uncharacterized protein n=1 Tax=Chromera velia CCMP2878 TaxID=1169474 RepID=A0A0G4GH47_9ALVE|mmetsp:Transcript_11111/g.21454  ORF Transcript_11111/g.21454 Transcript_11111/m.21454 type:complete len:146 (+) Transcript_11111:232-669(+)|eukprot:Cvel_21821.t1-p1 / transcript=Cvel_21821.t1 / gene=Cvel_21821 / organism=Chromera_velia_CCMP2878 / gene_product=hypothetical protein / transcript_product=hypothetical protein / location=Cvel_scaffold2081:13857-15417(+) / protein_length=145 / sequence_SO=supercontig / SO=protein_coding / is_pseudo=false
MAFPNAFLSSPFLKQTMSVAEEASGEVPQEELQEGEKTEGEGGGKEISFNEMIDEFCGPPETVLQVMNVAIICLLLVFAYLEFTSPRGALWWGGIGLALILLGLTNWVMIEVGRAKREVAARKKNDDRDLQPQSQRAATGPSSEK